MEENFVFLARLTSLKATISPIHQMLKELQLKLLILKSLGKFLAIKVIQCKILCNPKPSSILGDVVL